MEEYTNIIRGILSEKGFNEKRNEGKDHIVIWTLELPEDPEGRAVVLSYDENEDTAVLKVLGKDGTASLRLGGWYISNIKGAETVAEFAAGIRWTPLRA